MTYLNRLRCGISIASLWFVSGLSAQETQNAETSDEEVYVLSPFTVDTEQDKGYRATNSISGSRLNTAIKDIPMPIEVITEQFLKDVGAKDLRESLKYSAGILLSSQNDSGQQNSFVNAGGVHSTEGATAAKTQTSIKLRGFITDSVLRDGFRRQHSTDSANIGRVEVVRGPAALLYGIGNFGGIVNYMPKAPLDEDRTEAIIGFGSDGFYRGALDYNESFDGNEKLGFRLALAAQKAGSPTELFEEEHFFVAPILQYKPYDGTTLTFDFEYGEDERSGIGFQSVRARADVPADQQDRLERAGFLEFAGKDRRTFRWSGPDTYLNTKSYNTLIKIEQKITDNLFFLAGINKSMARFAGLDVGGSLQADVGPVSLRDSITVVPLSADDNAFSAGTVDGAIFQYAWNSFYEKTNREQVRAELNYNVDTFGDSKWLGMTHNFLVGRSEEYSDKKGFTNATADGLNNYKSPTDSSYIRFGSQGDGSPDEGMNRVANTRNEAWNQGTYAVYQGNWLDDRVTVVAGKRRDRNDNHVVTVGIENPASSSNVDRDAQTKDTSQLGVSIKITREISLFALEADGLVPNFEGLRDGNGVPIDATLAKSKELGVKVDLFNGKLSGTISAFTIERTGTPHHYWWSPAPAKKQFDASKDVVYLVQGANPEVGQADWAVAQQNAVTEWTAAKTAGAAFLQDGKWYLNASNSAGAAYMDKVYSNVSAGQGWPGWYFDIDDPNVNIATMDRAAPDRGTYQAWSSGDDESRGWDAQLLFTPTDQIQLFLTYSNLEREVLNVGTFPEHPAGETDRWANWYFPDGAWGLSGFSLEDAYGAAYDSSTWLGAGYLDGGADDDSPEHAGSFWASYTFLEDGAVGGLVVGLGGQYESERAFISARTDGSGQKQVDANGNPIELYTDPRFSLDAMVQYNFNWDGRESRVQLNITNLLDDTDQYGLGFAQGISARLEFGVIF